jgi:hypothetical protein
MKKTAVAVMIPSRPWCVRLQEEGVEEEGAEAERFHWSGHLDGVHGGGELAERGRRSRSHRYGGGRGGRVAARKREEEQLGFGGAAGA